MASQPVNYTWDPREHRFVPIQAEPAPVVLPLDLRFQSLAENFMDEILNARTFGKPNQVILDPSVKKYVVTYWHAWKVQRHAVISVRNIKPFLSSAAGDAPCTTGVYAITVDFEEDVEPSQKSNVEKIFTETCKVQADENQTFTPERKGWIQLRTAELIPQRAGSKPACIFNLVVTVVSDKVSHPLSKNEAERFEQVRWTNEAMERRRVSDHSVFAAHELESRIKRMESQGATLPELKDYIKAVKVFIAKRDYLKHRAEVAELNAKKWMDIAYPPAEDKKSEPTAPPAKKCKTETTAVGKPTEDEPAAANKQSEELIVGFCNPPGTVKLRKTLPGGQHSYREVRVPSHMVAGLVVGDRWPYNVHVELPAIETIKVASVEGFKKGDLIEQTQEAIIIAVGDKSITVRHPNGEQQTLMLSTDTQARPGMHAVTKKVATVLAVNQANNELHITPWQTKREQPPELDDHKTSKAAAVKAAKDCLQKCAKQETDRAPWTSSAAPQWAAKKAIAVYKTSEGFNPDVCAHMHKLIDCTPADLDKIRDQSNAPEQRTVDEWNKLCAVGLLLAEHRRRK